MPALGGNRATAGQPPTGPMVIVSFNGKREKLKLESANTKMSDVLLNALSLFSIPQSDSSKFLLKHRSKKVDLTLPFRWSGVGSNATVELQSKYPFDRTATATTEPVSKPTKADTSSSSSSSTKVRIQIRFDTGKQYRGEFVSSTTLSDILKCTEIDDVETLVFMQQRINKNEFESTQLLSIGIQGGSAAFRANTNSKKTKDVSQPSPALPPKYLEPKQSPMPDIAQSIKALREKYFDDDCQVIVKTLGKIISTILAKPGDVRVRQLKHSNANFAEKVGRFPFALVVLQSVGFTISGDRQVLLLQPENEDHDRLNKCLEHLSKLGSEVGLGYGSFRPQQSRSDQTAPAQQADFQMPAFDPFKSNVVRINPQPRGKKSQIEVEVENLRAKYDKIMQDAGIPPRDLRMFEAGSTVNPRQFVKPEKPVEASKDDGGSNDDMKVVLQAAKAQMKKQKESEKFRTKAMRDLETLKKTRVFTKTLIRVQFPDRFVIQAYFSPQEPISEVMELLRKEVLNSPLHDKFYLYTTPPMTKYSNMKQTLLEAQLVPACLVHLGWLNDEAPKKENYLSDSANTLLNDDMEIDEAHFPSSIPVSNSQMDGTTAGATSSSNNTSSSGSSSSSNTGGVRPKKVPKWLKLGY